MLSGGLAAAIQVPVTVNSGGVLVPDASQASTSAIGSTLTINAGGILQWAFNGPAAEGTIALGNNALNLPASGNPVFRPQFTPGLGEFVMTWNSSPSNQPAWSFDTSLQSLGSTLVWGINGAGSWDTGTNWDTALLTGGSLSYQAGGLQVASLNYNDTPGTAAPGPGAGVTIAPLAAATQNVAVAGPVASVSVGVLTINGNNPYTASLTLSGTGTLSAASVSVLSGGALLDNSGSGSLATPTLAIGGGNVGLSNAATGVGSVTITSGGTLDLSGGSVGSAAITSGLLSAIGGSVATLTPAAAIRRSPCRRPSATATVSGTAVVNLNNTNTMSSLTVSGGTVSTSINTITTAVVNGGTFNPQNSTISGFTQSSGTTTFGTYVTVGTADVSAGVGTVNATNPITIQSTLKLPAGVTATVSAPRSTPAGPTWPITRRPAR